MNWKTSIDAQTWIPILNLAEEKYHVPKDLSARQCFEESGFNPQAKNPSSGCIGLMQLLPKDFPGAGIDPVKDIDKGVEYLAHLYVMFKDWQLALAAYDWGPGNLRKQMKKPGFGLAALPPETRKYVTQIIGDVPVPGALCKIPSLPASLGAGRLPEKPLVEPSSGSSSDSSLFSRLISIWRKSPPQSLPSLSPGLSKPLLPILSPQTTGVNSMTNPALVAIAPALNNVLDAVNQFGVDIGPDPAKWAVTVLPAAQKLLSAVELQIPVVITAEGGQLQGLIAAKVQELKAKLAAAVTPPPAAVAAPSLVPGMPSQSA